MCLNCTFTCCFSFNHTAFIQISCNNMILCIIAFYINLYPICHNIITIFTFSNCCNISFLKQCRAIIIKFQSISFCSYILFITCFIESSCIYCCVATHYSISAISSRYTVCFNIFLISFRKIFCYSIKFNFS